MRTAATTRTPGAGDAATEALRHKFKKLAGEGRTDELIDLVLEILGHARRNNDALTARLGQALRQLYGRKSEKVDSAQLAFLLDALGDAVPQSAQEAAEDEADDNATGAPDPDPGTTDDPIAPPPTKPRATAHKGRRPLPENLPRETRKVRVPEAQRVCVECGGTKSCIGHVRSEVLEFEPAHFKIVVELREKMACENCESGVVVAPTDKVIDRGRPGPGLLAHIVVDKFQDSMPLYRQAQAFARYGVVLSASTLGDWSSTACDILIPVARRLKEKVIKADYIQGDDTILRVLDRGHVNGVKRGHLWAYVANRIVVFDYTPDWKKEGPVSFLKDFRGFLQCDGYPGFDAALKPADGSQADAEKRRLGCGMHIRRNFEAAADANDARCAIALAYFRKLYRIEESCKTDMLSTQQRLARRQELSLPVLDDLYSWAHQLEATVVPGTPAHKAVTYAINQEHRFRLCFTDGRFEIDNGECERQERRVAIGRKNYLFAGSDKGAERIAVAYTVLGTCHMNGVNPIAYLTDVITKLQDGWPKSRLDELLPQNWIQPV